jgi:hypothetical protein
MTNPQSVNWRGQSGTEYTYYLYPCGTDFNKGQAGNFVLAKQTSPGHFVPIYIGQGADLNDAIANNGKKSCIDLNGATHLHVHVSSADVLARLREVEDLVLRWKPVCNGTPAH